MSTRTPVTRYGAGSAVVLAAATMLGACASMVPVPPTPMVRNVTVPVPRITPLPQTVETQARDGISLTLAPTPFTLQNIEQCEYEPHQALLFVLPEGVSRETHTLFREARYEAPWIGGDELWLLLTIRNQMDRVFRGAGSVVEFNVDGRAQGIEQSNYADLITALIPPRGEAQIRIKAPPLASMPAGATLGIFLYDVVTETDAAGNILSRENFEWYFSVSHELVSEEISAPRRTVWIPNSLSTLAARGNNEGRCLAGVYPRDNY